MRVLILAGDSDGNLGDRAIVLSTCRALRRALPDVQISLMSNDPAAAEYFDALAIPRGIAGFTALLSAARRADLVLVGGGGLFQDDDSLIKMPYWALRIAMIRLLCRRIVGYSIGAGPLRSRLSKWSARLALLCMARVSVRDEIAREYLQPLSRMPVELVPDPALILQPTWVTPPAPDSQPTQPVIGVAVRQWFHHVRSFVPHKYAVKYHLRAIPGAQQQRELCVLLAEALDRAAAELGARVVFLPTYNVSHEADDSVCRDVMALMKTADTRVEMITDPDAYLTRARELSVMVGGRMHPTILAAEAHVPIVGLAYNEKFQGFFKLLKLDKLAMNVNDFVAGRDVDGLVALIHEALQERDSMAERLAPLQQQVSQFNTELFQQPSPTLSADPALDQSS